jgi:hypothetical protein
VKAKLLFAVLALVILGEIIWAIFYLTQPLKFFQKVPQSSPTGLKPAGGAILLLEPPNGEFKINSAFDLNIVLDTKGNPVTGVDSILRFDPARLEAIDSQPEAPGVQITEGRIFGLYLGNTVNSQTGRIAMSGITKTGTIFNGRGVLATVTFKTKVAGKTKVFFEFQPAVTSDSNVAGAFAKDILDKTVGGEYSIISN